MPTLRVEHAKCTECRMCYFACEEIGINAVYIDLEPRHRFEIDTHKCTYPTCGATAQTSGCGMSSWPPGKGAR